MQQPKELEDSAVSTTGRPVVAAVATGSARAGTKATTEPGIWMIAPSSRLEKVM